MTERMNVHERTLTAKNQNEMMDAYAEWADQYDADLTEEWGYEAPQLAVDLLLEYLEEKSAFVLDAGCGTGLVGAILHQRGYRNLLGVDYSADMLQIARKKNVYKDLSQVDLNLPLPYEHDCFDAVICVGTFTLGHVSPQALKEMVRVTQKGGYICFTVRDQFWEEEPFSQLLARMHIDGGIELHELKTDNYIEKEGVRCKLVLIEVSTKGMI